MTNAAVSRPATIHFIGICGTGMAGLACLLKRLGYDISGSDESVYPPISTVLEREGIEIRRYDTSNLEGPLSCIILGAGVSRNNCEAVRAVARGVPVLSYPEALARYVLDGRDVHVVAGTHGKTTTTSMLAWIHEQAGTQPGFFVGGLPKDFGETARLPQGGAMIIEGDEYKSSNLDLQPKFLKYSPRLAIITNIEFDHGDVFPNLRAVIDTFAAFAGRIAHDGALVLSAAPEVTATIRDSARCRVVTVGRDYVSDWRVIDCGDNGKRTLEIYSRDTAHKIGPITLQVPGMHNVDNAALAAVAAHMAGIDTEAIVRAVASFTGVRRRLDVVARHHDVRLFDDFAHHPSEVAASIAALKSCDPKRRIWAIFEPRSATSKTPRFQREYEAALSLADRATIAAVPLRNDGASVLDTTALADSLARRGIPARSAVNADQIVAEVGESLGPATDILVMSSGPFGDLVEKLKSILWRV